MKAKGSTEFENFDKVMGGLLAVPYSELQEKLDEEKKAKERRKGRVKGAKASGESRTKRPRGHEG